MSEPKDKPTTWRDLFLQKPPSIDQVNKFHEKSDKDGSPKSQHHTLGPNPNQAAAGNHNHDGGNSAQLLAGTTLSGSRANTALMITQIHSVLVALGASDNTTP